MMDLPKQLLAAAAVVVTLMWAGSGFAETGFKYKINKKVRASDGYPTLTLQATGEIESGTASFSRSDGHTFDRQLKAMKAGQTQTISIKQPTGRYSYTVHLTAKGPDEQTVETDIRFKAARVGELELQVDPDRVRVGQGKVPVSATRPIDHVEVQIFGGHGQKLHQKTQNVGGTSRSFVVRWPPTEDVSAIRLKAYDVDGFWRSILLEPFWVEIPHKEVRFKFGKASWNADQRPKLKATLKNIRQAMQKHGDKGLEMKLYVAGYTDTVGKKRSNRALSTARAQAIGRWFHKKGLNIPVYYQGFGESVLKVDTADETKEAKNRRAIYVLGNAQPPTSSAIPKSRWKRVE